MIDRILLAILFVSAAWVATPSAMAASCGTGYLERFDRKGEPFCISAALERSRQLKLDQMLREKRREWRATLIRDRQAQQVRQAQIEQRRRDRELN